MLGLWFAPMREALDAYVDKIQERVTGVVRLKLLKGDCTAVDCTTAPPYSGKFIALDGSALTRATTDYQ